MLVGFVAIGVAGLRRRVFGWPSTIALIAAGLINFALWPYAPGAIVAGIVMAAPAVRRE
ncbi:hypothetical protein [Occultella kanbiaonis]|uniref:hypothetical protein n=1 Tax=Occultella kanbiaonis TaxID=2675754 RepID=UPI0013D6E303|nr:hypothetical protein [Occultella kanbiaonis]